MVELTENSFFTKLISQEEDDRCYIYVFETENHIYKLYFLKNTTPDDVWIIDYGPIGAEMTDSGRYGTLGVEQAGFRLEATDDKIQFEITNPEKVNLGILLGITRVDPLSVFQMLVFRK